MKDSQLKAAHVYAHDPDVFQNEVNEAFRRIVDAGGSVGDILYAIDPSDRSAARGGFGALIVYEIPKGAEVSL